MGAGETRSSTRSRGNSNINYENKICDVIKKVKMIKLQ